MCSAWKLFNSTLVILRQPDNMQTIGRAPLIIQTDLAFASPMLWRYEQILLEQQETQTSEYYENAGRLSEGKEHVEKVRWVR